MHNKLFLKKTLIEVCSPQLYVSFGSFYTQIGHCESLKYVESLLSISKENVVDFGILLNVARMIDQFGRKRFQKKHKDVEYKPL